MSRLNRMALVGALVFVSPLAMAAVSDAEFQALKDSLAALTQKLEVMEQERAAEKAKAAQAPAPVPAPVAVAKPAPSAWADRVALQGDFRYRYDTIDPENAPDRNRQRIRARAAIIAKPVDNVEVGFGLSTTENNNPTSANQTLGNGGSRKNLYFDLAYFNWTAAEGLNLLGGKFKNNLYRPGKNSLIWDNDLNPEGFGASYLHGPFFANILSAWIESDSGDNTRSQAVAVGGQAGVMWPLTDSVKLTAGAGYVRLNTEGKGVFYQPGATPRFFGNSVDANNRYLFDYDEMEGFAELGLKLFGQPALVFFDYVQNTDADAFDTGWSAGATLGAAKGKGSWEVGYTYQDLEADAVFGLWTDDDFGGGGADTRGHLIRGAYALSDRTNLAMSYYLTQFGKNAGNELDYNRLFLDLNFRY